MLAMLAMLRSYRGYLSGSSLKPHSTSLSLPFGALPSMSPPMLVTGLSFLLILFEFQLTLGTPLTMGRPPHITPQIGPGFSIEEMLQLKNAFYDALEIAMAAVQSPGGEAMDETRDKIFAKYFLDEHRYLVNGKTLLFFF